MSDKRATHGLLIFAVALSVRLLHVWQIRRTPFFDVLMGDARGYDEWARRIAAGDWIGHDVFYQAPLYPYFLGTIYAIAGRSLLLIRVCQAVLGSFSCVLLGLAARRLFSPKTGVIAGLGLALYAPAIFFNGLLQKSALDEFFMCLMLWLSVGVIEDPRRPRSWLWLGLATGGLSLTRENALVFVAVILTWALAGTWIAKRIGPVDDRPSRVRLKPDSTLSVVGSAFRRAAFFVLGLAIVLLPVAIRNNSVGGGFYLTTSQFGPNFFMGNNEHADGTAMSLRAGRGDPQYERQDAVDIAEQARGRRLTPGEVSGYWTEQALAFAESHPVAWLKLQLRKTVLLWNATEILDTESQESYAEWSTPLRVLGGIGHFGVLVPLALFGLLLAWPDRARLWPLVAMGAAYAASVVMFYIYARYRYPLVPILWLFAATGLAGLPAFARSFSSPGRDGPPEAGPHRVAARAAGGARRRVSIAVAVGAMVVFTNWSIVSADMNRTVTEHNLGAALQSEGRYDEAIASYRRALAISPDYAPAYSNIGTVLQAQGHVDAAIDSYQRALAIRPGFPEVHYNLANALLSQNRTGEAAGHFRLAARGIPGSADVHNNLGAALAEEGKLDEAIAEFEQAARFDPASAKAHRNLGDTLASAGRTDEGLAHLRRAVQLDPRDASAHYDLGSLLLEERMIPDAIAEFRAAIAIEPTSVEAHNNLGIALGSTGNFDNAIREFQEALRLKPDFAEARRNLDMTLQAQQQTRKRP